MKLCIECNEPAYARDLCKRHHMRDWRRRRAGESVWDKVVFVPVRVHPSVRRTFDGHHRPPGHKCGLLMAVRVPAVGSPVALLADGRRVHMCPRCKQSVSTNDIHPLRTEAA